MKIGIVGLGLIGGSLAKAFKTGGHSICGYDNDPGVLQYAQLTGVIDQVLTAQNTADCDYLFIALYPAATLQYLTDNADIFAKSSVIIDCCGVKEIICPHGFQLAEQHGFTFIGGHPMAGIQYSGLKHARENLFHNASMILVPKKGEDISLLEKTKTLLQSAGFAQVTVSTAAEHDRIIAFTSQLAHVVSNAYVKSPSAVVHKGFSAGSYRDLTRVARLNENMWAELFLDNSQNLSTEISTIISELTKYKNAIDQQDFAALKDLLREGREKKEKIEGRI